MAVFRVERNTGYTVMSNHHLRNKELTLKAKGLLSQMLSLPEDWDYTLAGLSHINREKIDAIREAVKELEKAGYNSLSPCGERVPLSTLPVMGCLSFRKSISETICFYRLTKPYCSLSKKARKITAAQYNRQTNTYRLYRAEQRVR